MQFHCQNYFWFANVLNSATIGWCGKKLILDPALETEYIEPAS